MKRLDYEELIRCKKAKVRVLKDQIWIVSELKILNNEGYCDEIWVDYKKCLRVQYSKNENHLILIDKWIDDTVKSIFKELA
jgi:hypothetical protein